MKFRVITGTPSQPAGPAPCGEPPAQTEASRALVTLIPMLAANDAPDTFRQAPFLAQLLAMRDQHPQTRERRRAEPHEAVAAYRAAAALAGR
jgi:hypothetical protein